jgi:hypothetical protein
MCRLHISCECMIRCLRVSVSCRQCRKKTSLIGTEILSRIKLILDVRIIISSYVVSVDCVWNVMTHAQKPDFVFRRNGRVHLNRWGCQFSRLLAAEVCASAVLMLDTPRSEYPLHSQVSPSPPPPRCVTVCHHISTGLYLISFAFIPDRMFYPAVEWSSS